MMDGLLRGVLAGLALLTACGRVMAASETAPEGWPGKSWPTVYPAADIDQAALRDAIAYGGRRGGAGIVVRHGYLVGSWGDIHAAGDLSSATKAWGSLVTGLAIDDGLLAQDTAAITVDPGFAARPRSVRQDRRERVTVHQLLTMTAGFGSNTPAYPPLSFEPGTVWYYSNGATNWLADVVTRAYGRDLRRVLQERVLDPIGVTEFTWRADVYRGPRLGGLPRREFASGMGTSVDGQARVGLLMLRRGAWKGRQLISRSYAEDATSPHRDVASTRLEDGCAGQNGRYGLLWFTNVDGGLAGVPRDAYLQWGAKDVFTLVVPSLDLVLARQGRALGDGCLEVLAPLAGLVVDAMR